MDPSTQAFTPYSTNTDTWRVQGDLARLQQISAEHADRIARLERRQDEDARVKSVWGNSSPFPSVLSGTPQQAPLQHPASDRFGTFDEDASNLMSSLHLDAEEEPRRAMGATSRANSVRFDESANQNHFTHLHRPSFDYLSRTSSGTGAMISLGDRSASHKSDGRASSAHSMRSAASGRPGSLNLDTTYAAGGSSRSSQDAPAMAPGLLLLGSVPAIIRCWMNTNFKHDALLYAAVCTGSYKSFLALTLVQKLDFEDQINTNPDGSRQIELPVYLPEAVPHPASSRSSSPAPQLPSLTVSFQVIDISPAEDESKAIQIFLGSDTLRLHSADILFSSNSMTLLDDDRCKLSIPLVRPENQAVFNTLRITSAAASSFDKDNSAEHEYLNGLGQDNTAETNSTSIPPVNSTAKYRPPPSILAEAAAATNDSTRSGAAGGFEGDNRPVSRASNASRPSLITTGRTESIDGDSVSATTAQRSASGSPAVWSSWRRDTSAPTSASTQATPLATSSSSGGLDWGAVASKNRDSLPYQRKDTGIKVLKPKSASRTFSTSSATGSTNIQPTTAALSSTSGNANVASPLTSDSRSSSRFFDEGRRRSGGLLVSVDSKADSLSKEKENAQAASSTGASSQKTRANPVGTGSAFSWLNSGGS